MSILQGSSDALEQWSKNLRKTCEDAKTTVNGAEKAVSYYLQDVPNTPATLFAVLSLLSTELLEAAQTIAGTIEQNAAGTLQSQANAIRQLNGNVN